MSSAWMVESTDPLSFHPANKSDPSFPHFAIVGIPVCVKLQLENGDNATSTCLQNVQPLSTPITNWYHDWPQAMIAIGIPMPLNDVQPLAQSIHPSIDAKRIVE